MRRMLLLAAVAALLVPAAAAAKGPSAASLSGPGLEHALRIPGQGEAGVGTPLGTLVELGGFFPQMFGQSPDPTAAKRPQGTLGPRYLVTYTVPGPAKASRVVQLLYPFAKPVPLTYMRPAQPFWTTERTHGGWFRSTPQLTDALIRAGLPRR